MEDQQQPGLWQLFLNFLTHTAEWVRLHEDEIRTVGVWSSVGVAGRGTRLYVPLHREAWLRIQEADRGSDKEPDYEALIMSLYGPDGIAFDALREELVQAPLLADRQHEVEEVLDSLVDRRHFVTVCGALPLVEYVLSNAAGEWNDPRKHMKALDARLRQSGGLSSDAEAMLLLEATAVEMVLEEIPEIWKDGRQNVGSINEKLNRHLALHGTARGWDNPANAIRSVLLLAAVARIAEPLLGTPPTAAP